MPSTLYIRLQEILPCFKDLHRVMPLLCAQAKIVTPSIAVTAIDNLLKVKSTLDLLPELGRILKESETDADKGSSSIGKRSVDGSRNSILSIVYCAITTPFVAHLRSQIADVVDERAQFSENKV